MQVARIDGIHLHYRLNGSTDAPTVVFANSLGTDFRIWDSVLERLGPDVQSLCYDKRGHGLSDAPAAPYTIDDHIDDLIGLMTHLNIHRALICGVSVGGMIALGLGARRPELARGLMLCDTAHKIGSDDLWNERIAQIRAHGIAAIADGILDRWFSAGFRQLQGDAVAGWRNMLVRTPIEGYVGTCAALRDADLTAEAGALRLPVRCLCGSEDGATPPELVEAMRALISEAGFELVQGAGHLPCIESPGSIAAIIEDFLREIAP